jgi:uncharacterized protein (DUF58 family)
MLSFADLRARAETLADSLPAFNMLTGFRTTARAGAAPRQRSGDGEDFWQYRGQTPDDTAGAIDWRRSATGDELYIREHELQSARLLGIWADGSKGFDWKSPGTDLTKADVACILLTAIAVRYSENGDLAGVIDGNHGVTASHHLMGPIIDDFMHISTALPGVPRPDTAQIIIASDFYGPIDPLTEWVRQSATEGRNGVLLQVIDPMEDTFPFSGRVRFRQPGSGSERVFGRTELLKDAYSERFKARQHALADLAGSVGWHFFIHNTAAPMTPTAYAIMTALNQEVTG